MTLILNLLIFLLFWDERDRLTIIREGGRDGEPASTVLLSFILDVCLKFNTGIVLLIHLRVFQV